MSASFGGAAGEQWLIFKGYNCVAIETAEVNY